MQLFMIWAKTSDSICGRTEFILAETEEEAKTKSYIWREALQENNPMRKCYVPTGDQLIRYLVGIQNSKEQYTINYEIKKKTADEN